MVGWHRFEKEKETYERGGCFSSNLSNASTTEGQHMVTHVLHVLVSWRRGWVRIKEVGIMMNVTVERKSSIDREN